MALNMQPGTGDAREDGTASPVAASGKGGSPWLVCAFDVRDGSVVSIGERDLNAPIDEGWRWIHLDRARDEARDWLCERSGLTPLVVEALLAEETRPRVADMGEGLLLILRAVNLNPGAEPEEMIALRLWLESARIVSVAGRRVLAVGDLERSLASGEALASPGAFVAELADLIVGRTEDVVDDIDDALERLEGEADADAGARDKHAAHSDRRRDVAGVRRQVVPLRRYLSPQRDAISALASHEGLFAKRDRHHLRETKDRLARLIEDLDSIGERASILHQELSNRLSEEMNRSGYVLTAVSTIMLPLTFITGLLGMNVGGVPGGEHEWGFVLTMAALLGIGGLIVALFKWLRWL